MELRIRPRQGCCATKPFEDDAAACSPLGGCSRFKLDLPAISVQLTHR